MTKHLRRVNNEIIRLKKEIWKLWKQKETSDWEVLELADKIDRLLNLYDYLLRKS